MAYARAGAPAVVVDVIANDSDPEGAFAGCSLGVLAPAAVGSTTRDVRSGARQALSYLPGAAGYDAAVYAVCDISGVCGLAEVTVAVLGDV